MKPGTAQEFVDKVDLTTIIQIEDCKHSSETDELVILPDESWNIIAPLLPAERGRNSRPAQDNRRYFEGMVWIARTGSRWRHLPAEYGRWNSIFRRYRRWAATGVFDMLFRTLSELIHKPQRDDQLDNPLVHAFQCVVCVQIGLARPNRLADERRNQAPASNAPPKAIATRT